MASLGLGGSSSSSSPPPLPPHRHISISPSFLPSLPPFPGSSVPVSVLGYIAAAIFRNNPSGLHVCLTAFPSLSPPSPLLSSPVGPSCAAYFILHPPPVRGESVCVCVCVCVCWWFFFFVCFVLIFSSIERSCGHSTNAVKFAPVTL